MITQGQIQTIPTQLAKEAILMKKMRMQKRKIKERMVKMKREKRMPRSAVLTTGA